MGSFYGINMPDEQWLGLSPEQRIQYLSNRGGPTGNAVDAIRQGKADHPNWNSSNYFDKVFNALARGGGNIPEANVPSAGSMIGMMSGDAGADIADAKAAAGPNPLDDYVPPAYKVDHPEWGDKQEQRYRDYQTTVGQKLGDITGLPGGYDPAQATRNNEGAAIQGGMTADQIARRAAWLKQLKAFHGGGG